MGHIVKALYLIYRFLASPIITKKSVVRYPVSENAPQKKPLPKLPSPQASWPVYSSNVQVNLLVTRVIHIDIIGPVLFMGR